MKPKTWEHVASYLPKGKTFLEVLTEGRQGYRQKRQPFVFNAIRDRLLITDGADPASLASFADEHHCECDQAFHRILSE